MEIPEIKSRLTLKEVLDYYNLKPDKHLRLNCPFHPDKTPSLQVYWKTHTAYCFSSNCPTHGKALDVIDFILYMEKTDKHRAILKAQELIGGNGQPTAKELTRSAVLLKMFTYFKNGVHNSKPAKEYLQTRHLDFEKLDIGYNSGQFHHGTRKDEALIKSCVKYGLLLDKGKKGRTGEPAYQPFGKGGICFALKNREGKITGLYFRSVTDNKKSKHFYLKDRQGLYPKYPKPETQKLILTEAIVDAATLLQREAITKNFEVLSLYGTNGLTDEHLAAIKGLNDLEEVVFWFDGDEAGNKAAEKYRTILSELRPGVKISQVLTPENEDINSLLDGHQPEILTNLLANRQALTTEEPSLFFSNERKVTESSNEKKKEVNPTALDFLKTGNVLKNLSEIIGQCGIVGEENSRLLLFLLTLSYKNGKPLHGIVQGSSGSGKTHLISRIADMMPQEDVLRFTRITEGSLYNWGEYDLFKKVIVIEDLDGLEEKALYALREFISNQVLRSSVTVKDKKGNNKSRKKEVKGQFSSLSATTKGETYEDNMNRSFLLAVDESQQQTGKIINYQNRRAAGEVDENQEQENIRFIREVVRLLKPYTVINSFAPKIQLPEKVQQVRRLNEMYQAVIKQVALVNQYQRQVKDGKLVAQIEDVEQATEILFESIVLKVDELDGSLRGFYEKLKKSFGEKEFSRFEAMAATGFKKTQLQFYLNELLRFEYLKQKGFANKGYKYQVSHNDNQQAVRQEIKSHFERQIAALKSERQRTLNGHQANASGKPMMS